MILYQGLARLPESKNHWDPSELFSTVGSMYIKKLRFQMIHKFISFYGTKVAMDNKKLQKIDILLRIPELWRKYYTPCQELNLDETHLFTKRKMQKYCSLKRFSNERQ